MDETLDGVSYRVQHYAWPLNSDVVFHVWVNTEEGPGQGIAKMIVGDRYPNSHILKFKNNYGQRYIISISNWILPINTMQKITIARAANCLSTVIKKSMPISSNSGTLALRSLLGVVFESTDTDSTPLSLLEARQNEIDVATTNKYLSAHIVSWRFVCKIVYLFLGIFTSFFSLLVIWSLTNVHGGDPREGHPEIIFLMQLTS